ncbi:D-alanyl-D-alanine carboxypeptidase family protein [Aquabacterium sp. CECT 9606]|uniref:D-alanyl-D-alanine carboxypeptidase family protein n=1 Tax=Aquabacterium sp. CECT 9606 TaxID=2845822 RepID=UPI001E64151A|nr:D-alanyl-D-alanine carboxypeptidase family protein [Aquabacterium sp. CECT 9606]CAH0351945.1 D-alanyl-D-alanine carboxypeptidase DacC [Aquabacterium sp. CECT 9606]
MNIGSAKPHWQKALAVLTACFSVSASAAIAIAPAPTLDNTAYVVMDFESGRILSQVNAEQPLPPASLTKMMTSYIVEQALKAGRLKPTDMVSVSENAWCRGTSAESCMYLPVHGSASVMDILRGIIVQSGNDASKAIAEHMAGSEASFAVLMNKEAERLGMKNTHFVNATGLPDPAHRASAHDLAILARAIIRDSSDYYKIYAEKEFKYNGIKQGNRNALLYTDSSVDGLKTGHTAEAGFCLTASSKRGDMRLISVIMGTKSMQARADQTRALFNWGFGSFEDVRPLAANTPLATPKVRFGKAEVVKVGLTEPMVATIPRGQAANVKSDIQLNPGITAPIAKGAVLGKVVISLDGQGYGEQALVALEPVEEAGFFSKLWQRIKEFFSSK